MSHLSLCHWLVSLSVNLRGPSLWCYVFKLPSLLRLNNIWLYAYHLLCISHNHLLFISHLYIFFGEMSTQGLCPLLIVFRFVFYWVEVWQPFQSADLKDKDVLNFLIVLITFIPWRELFFTFFKLFFPFSFVNYLLMSLYILIEHSSISIDFFRIPYKY